MTQEGFEEYISSVYESKNGTARCYIAAIRIIDELFKKDDIFGLKGKSIASIEDLPLLILIEKFIHSQQVLFNKGEDSFFRNINPNQKSYPGKRFCSSAMKQLKNYFKYYTEEKKAELIVCQEKKGIKVSYELIKIFEIDKEGNDSIVQAKVRLGQSYFRKMILANYEGKCCITGLNVPQTLRASHIIAWAEDKKHRMDPENGLCLSATYDAAFDKHLISFDEDFRMIVS